MLAKRGCVYVMASIYQGGSEARWAFRVRSLRRDFRRDIVREHSAVHRTTSRQLGRQQREKESTHAATVASNACAFGAIARKHAIAEVHIHPLPVMLPCSGCPFLIAATRLPSET